MTNVHIGGGLGPAGAHSGGPASIDSHSQKAAVTVDGRAWPDRRCDVAELEPATMSTGLERDLFPLPLLGP